MSNEYEWVHLGGLVHLADDVRYLADNFGELVLVPFCGRDDEYLEH